MSEDRFNQIRLLEALFFASKEPLGEKDLRRFFPEEADLAALIEELAGLYANRGVNLVRLGQRWAFRSAADLAPQMRIETEVQRKLSRAALETLAIVAYHQPATRGEIEEIRGVALSKGTLDTLLEAGFIRPRGRRRTPGRPVTWGTSEFFLDHFQLESLDALPGVEELKAAGLIDKRPAITALGARGLLPKAGETEAEDGEESESEEGEALSAEFGEDLLPEDAEEEVGEAQAGEAEDSVEAAGETSSESSSASSR
ncbi:MAG: SMC-Scp complex subunit ScpB [Rhodovibrionaceae bacterium]